MDSIHICTELSNIRMVMTHLFLGHFWVLDKHWTRETSSKISTPGSTACRAQTKLEQSLIQALTEPNVTWLQFSNKNWYFQVDCARDRFIESSLCFSNQTHFCLKFKCDQASDRKRKQSGIEMKLLKLSRQLAANLQPSNWTYYVSNFSLPKEYIWKRKKKLISIPTKMAEKIKKNIEPVKRSEKKRLYFIPFFLSQTTETISIVVLFIIRFWYHNIHESGSLLHISTPADKDSEWKMRALIFLNGTTAAGPTIVPLYIHFN